MGFSTNPDRPNIPHCRPLVQLEKVSVWHLAFVKQQWPNLLYFPVDKDKRERGSILLVEQMLGIRLPLNLSPVKCMPPAKGVYCAVSQV